MPKTFEVSVMDMIQALAHFHQAVLEVSMAILITKWCHLKEMPIVAVKEATTYKCLSLFFYL
jgi:hypothetical protein